MAPSAVLYSTKDDVAVLTINNPPVNALSSAVRDGLMSGIHRAIKDDSIQAVVITGAGKAFSGGADIAEFSRPPKGPGISEIGAAIEGAPKPVVAAIHGYALAGGMEVALFCHYRIATKSSSLALPEVQIGLLPGAHGTQRLPRVAPLAVAVEMISTGKQVSAYDGVKYGILDKVVDGDIVQEAVRFLALFRDQPPSARRLNTMPVRDAENKDKIFEDAMAQVTARNKGFIAPVYCLKAVKLATELPYEDGAKREWEMFQELMTSGQALALQYAFFCERNVAKWQLPSGENFRTVRPNPIKSVAVIGTGTMGTGIAVALLNSGFPTFVMDQNSKLLNHGVEMIKSLITGGVRVGKRTAQQAEAALALLTPVTKLDAIRNVDLVIEAVFENMAVKQDIFRKLDAACKPTTVLCSNTSTLDIDRIASATRRPDKVMGCHFFVPAYHMRLLENIYGSKTSPATVATGMELGRRMNKVTVLVGNCHGFCGNRLHGLMGKESQYLVEEGATPEQVDRVQEDFGFPLGTFKVSDLSGLDVGWSIRQEDLKDAGLTSKAGSRIKFLEGKRFCSLADQLCENGRLGRKTGKGWYRYDKPGSKVPYPDEEVTDIILKHCQENGIERRAIGPQEILERCFYSMINEGFRLLEENIVSQPEDIDTVLVHGFGWPRYLGGPMFYAEQIGLRAVYDRVCYYQQKHPTVEHWQPSELLGQLAERETPRKDWAIHARSFRQVSASKL